MNDKYRTETHYSTLRSYVRTTRFVLMAQVAAAILAAATTGFMLLELGPLLRERERLVEAVNIASIDLSKLKSASMIADKALSYTQGELSRSKSALKATQAERDNLKGDIDKASVALKRLTHQRDEARISLDESQTKLQASQRTILKAEQALIKMRAKAIEQRHRALKAQEASAEVVRRAVTAFHKKNYSEAISTYDSALKVDPFNVYIINLKSYSQFKKKNFKAAIRTMRAGLKIDPTYQHGYFDLMRYQCAAGNSSASLNTIRSVLSEATDDQINPLFPKNTRQDIRSDLSYFLKNDGEFSRLCRTIRGKLRELIDNKPVR